MAKWSLQPKIKEISFIYRMNENAVLVIANESSNEAISMLTYSKSDIFLYQEFYKKQSVVFILNPDFISTNDLL